MKSAIEVMRLALLMRIILQHHVPPQHRHQRGAEINRQEADAAGGRAPDAAVERPRRAVDRERQRVDVRIGDDAAAGVRALVAILRSSIFVRNWLAFIANEDTSRRGLPPFQQRWRQSYPAISSICRNLSSQIKPRDIQRTAPNNNQCSDAIVQDAPNAEPRAVASGSYGRR